jgi:uncharacterized alpha/beta hydrolase family protein
MEIIKDAESLKILFYVTSTVLAIAVVIIGYFMSRRDNAITNATDNLTLAVQQLKLIVNTLQLQYDIRQPMIDAQLELTRQSMIDFDMRLKHIEIDHAVFHCDYKIPGPKSNSTPKPKKTNIANRKEIIL